jgi:hypothetical protein
MEAPKFSKLIPLPVRPEAIQADKEIAPPPNFECHCCNDTGWIRPRLAALVIQGYHYQRDKTVICSRCNHGTQWGHLSESTDNRILPPTCDRLHQFAKAEDEEARRAQWENSKKINQLTLDFASSKNLRKDNTQRTTNENREALLNKENSQIQLDEAWGKYEPSH